MSDFKCPRCGGKYFGRHPEKDLVWCHNNTEGEGMSLTFEEWMDEKRTGKACNWRGPAKDCGMTNSTVADR